MEKVIDQFIESAAKANNFELVLRYQWVINSSESTSINILDQIFIQYAKGY